MLNYNTYVPLIPFLDVISVVEYYSWLQKSNSSSTWPLICWNNFPKFYFLFVTIYLNFFDDWHIVCKWASCLFWIFPNADLWAWNRERNQNSKKKRLTVEILNRSSLDNSLLHLHTIQLVCIQFVNKWYKLSQFLTKS